MAGVVGEDDIHGVYEEEQSLAEPAYAVITAGF